MQLTSALLRLIKQQPELAPASRTSREKQGAEADNADDDDDDDDAGGVVWRAGQAASDELTPHDAARRGRGSLLGRTAGRRHALDYGIAIIADGKRVGKLMKGCETVDCIIYQCKICGSEALFCLSSCLFFGSTWAGNSSCCFEVIDRPVSRASSKPVYIPATASYRL